MAPDLAETVRASWYEFREMPDEKAEKKVVAYAKRQPEVVGYLAAATEEKGLDSSVIAMEVAMSIDSAYKELLGDLPPKIEHDQMEAALDIVWNPIEQAEDPEVLEQHL